MVPNPWISWQMMRSEDAKLRMVTSNAETEQSHHFEPTLRANTSVDHWQLMEPPVQG